MRKILYNRDDNYFFERLLSFVHIYGIKNPIFVDYNNIKKNESYIYIKYYQNHPWQSLKQNQSKGDEDVFVLSKEYDIKFLFIGDNESGTPDSINYFEEHLSQFDVDLSKVYLVNNNRIIEKIKTEKNKINVDSFERIVWEGSNCIFMNNEIEFDVNSKKKLFQCYNRAKNSYRTAVITKLIKENIIDDVDWSHLREPMFLNETTQPPHSLSNPKITIYEYITGESFSDVEHIYKNLWEITPKKSEFELDYDFEPNGIIDLTMYYKKNPYKYSYVNIINESKFEEYDNEMIHITEKSLLPFAYFQFPIFFASAGHVKFLEEIYGFDMFKDVINHDYDNETNHKKRFQMLFNEIKKIHDKKDLIPSLYVERKERFLNNQKLAKDIYEKRKKVDIRKVNNIIKNLI